MIRHQRKRQHGWGRKWKLSWRKKVNVFHEVRITPVGSWCGVFIFMERLFYKNNFAGSWLSLLWMSREGRLGVAALQNSELGCLWNTVQICGLKSLAFAEIVCRISATESWTNAVGKIWGMKTVPISRRYLVTNGRSSHRKWTIILTCTVTYGVVLRV